MEKQGTTLKWEAIHRECIIGLCFDIKQGAIFIQSKALKICLLQESLL